MPASTPKKRKKTARKRKKKVSVSTPAVLAIAIAIVILIALIILKGLEKQPAEVGAPIPDLNFSACGIDISHNNSGPVIWDSLMVMVDRYGRTVKSIKAAKKVYPVKFVFIKASEGMSLKDPDFIEHWREASEHGIQRGAYHFFRSSKDGELQAKNFISAVGQLRHDDLPPVLDIETIHRGCSRKTLNSRALAWLKAIEKHYGVIPVVYTSDSFARDMLSKDITEKYPIWIAHYDVGAPEFQNWEFWQFTDRGYVYGLPEPVDLNLRR